MKLADRSRSAEVLFPFHLHELHNQLLAYQTGDSDEYNRLQQRLTKRAMTRKSPVPKQKNVGYIDKTISVSPSALNEKLHAMRDKFFKNLTKNYKPNVRPTARRDTYQDTFNTRRSGYSYSHNNSQLTIDSRSARDLHPVNLSAHYPVYEPSLGNESFENVHLSNEDVQRYFRRHSNPGLDYSHLPVVEPQLLAYNYLPQQILLGNGEINAHENSVRSRHETLHDSRSSTNSRKGQLNSLSKSRQEKPESRGSKLYNTRIGPISVANDLLNEENCNYALVKNLEGLEALNNDNFSFRDRTKTSSSRGKVSSYNHGPPDTFQTRSSQFSDGNVHDSVPPLKNTANPSPQQTRSSMNINPNLLYNGSTFGTIESHRYDREIYEYIQSTMGNNPDHHDVFMEHKGGKSYSSRDHQKNTIGSTAEDTARNNLLRTKSTDDANNAVDYFEESKQEPGDQIDEKYEFYQDYLRQRACAQLCIAFDKINSARMRRALQRIDQTVKLTEMPHSKHSSARSTFDFELLQKINSIVTIIKMKKKVFKQSAFERISFAATSSLVQKRDSLIQGCLVFSKVFESRIKLNQLDFFSKIKYCGSMMTNVKVANSWTIEDSPPLDKEVFSRSMALTEQKPLHSGVTSQNPLQDFTKNVNENNIVLHMREVIKDQRIVHPCVLNTDKENLMRGLMGDHQKLTKSQQKKGASVKKNGNLFKKDFFKEDIEELHRFFMDNTESAKESGRSYQQYEAVPSRVLGVREQNISAVKVSTHTSITKCSSNGKNDRSLQSNIKPHNQDSVSTSNRQNIRPYIQPQAKHAENTRDDNIFIEKEQLFESGSGSHAPLGNMNKFSRELYGESLKKVQSRSTDEQNHAVYSEPRILNSSQLDHINDYLTNQLGEYGTNTMSEIMDERSQSSQRILRTTSRVMSPDVDDLSSVGSERRLSFVREV